MQEILTYFHKKLKRLWRCIKAENKLSSTEENINPIFEEIKILVNDSRNRVYSAVNTEMLNLYWNIGKIIMEIQQGDERASYGDAVLEK